VIGGPRAGSKHGPEAGPAATRRTRDNEFTMTILRNFRLGSTPSAPAGSIDAVNFCVLVPPTCHQSPGLRE
jgi:hypothetical protein